ncbi:YqcC family protein [Pseudomonas sp. TCU-HL1]|uniref:YqcC family protein n=1 Tax=Pseudomonas sp. TCU-HL1 TaxID=1856685 RepID=UPI00083E5587|nr:YqcC family protein [Pseudomonas sp. TCU-HL1]AOE87429.1 pseudouridine synthase [Pseudomonas sp. TCU-HL1]
MDPRCVDVADQLLLIERELRGLGWWAEVPPSADALASQAPFCVDTLAFEEWLQWIFLPRMKVILENDLGLPHASGIRVMAEEVYRERLTDVSRLLDALGAFDRLIGQAN